MYTTHSGRQIAAGPTLGGGTHGNEQLTAITGVLLRMSRTDQLDAGGLARGGAGRALSVASAARTSAHFHHLDRFR